MDRDGRAVLSDGGLGALPAPGGSGPRVPAQGSRSVRNVLAICRSSCLRSVTTTMVALARRGSRRSFVASHSMVKDLPEPWVCQDHAAPLLRPVAGADPVQRRVHSAALLIAR